VATARAASPIDACRWEDACTAAALFAVDTAGIGGVSLRSLPGPARDRWLGLLAALLPRGCRIRRVPLQVTDGRLLGGLDLTATLRAGRPVAQRGLLAEADRGVVVLAMAERLTGGAAARITAVLDTGEVVLERDGFARHGKSRLGVVALDEGFEPDERPPAALLDRLALHLDLNGISAAMVRAADRYQRGQAAGARGRLSAVRARESVISALCETAAALGIGSARAPYQALRIARAAAALAGRDEVTDEDVELAARLVFAPRATRVPAVEPPDQSPRTPEPREDAAEPEGILSADARSPSERLVAPQDIESLEDRVLAATRAALPAELLAQLQLGVAGVSRGRTPGRAGAAQQSRARGRPVGTLQADPSAGGRVNVVETLRAAAPWQRLRRSHFRASNQRIQVRKGDLRITRFKQRTQTASIFLVDASGSAALHRLGEVKGAVELLLAECYVRRDRVALIAFRGKGAQLLLPPTRSLVRAKRSLAQLPAGGGTPLATGMDAARELADVIRRRGETPILIVMTDGRANVARDGKGGREAAGADALHAARLLRLERLTTLWVDTAPQPGKLAEGLAREMGAHYLPLPHADAAALAGAVRAITARGAILGSGSDP
jgi:magnesium chelatase subunit D